LTDKDEGVRLAVARRTDFAPTEAQMEKGLFDPNVLLKNIFEKFRHVNEPSDSVALDHIVRLLEEFNKIPTWTSAKKALAVELRNALENDGYLIFRGAGAHTIFLASAPQELWIFQ